MADDGLRVGVVLSVGEWWRRLNAHAADHGSNVEVVVVRDASAVLDSGLHIVCTDDTVLWFTKALVSEAGAAGISVVGVRTTGDPASDARLESVGIVHRINDSVAPTAMLDLLSRLRPLDTFDEIIAQLDVPTAGSDGSLIVVGGPPGAGSREVAIGLATVLAGHAATVLADCNESSPGVARRLGLQLQPHVVDAAAAAAAGSSLRSVTAQPADGLPGARLAFDVICGLTSPSEWRRLSVSSIDQVVEACRREWRYTVATTSPIVEDLHRWVDRYGLSRHLLATASSLVGVCEATPRGVLRFVDWIAECQPLQPVQTVINKVPTSRFAAGEVAVQLRSLCGDRVDVVATIPFDRRVVAAEWDAALPAKGPFTRAMRDIADPLLTTTSTPSRVVRT